MERKRKCFGKERKEWVRRIPQRQGHWNVYLLPRSGGGLEEQERGGLPAPACRAPPASFPPCLHSRLPKLFSSALELKRLAGDHHCPGGGAGAGRLATGEGREQPAFPRDITATHSSISFRNPPALFYPDRHTGSQLSRSRLCLLCPGTRRRSWARWLGPTTHLLCGLGQASNLSGPNPHPVLVTGARCCQRETVTAV